MIWHDTKTLYRKMESQRSMELFCTGGTGPGHLQNSCGIIQKAHNNTIIYRFLSEYPPQVRLKLKLEINCREHFSVLGWKMIPFKVDSDWFSGMCEITTYDINELLATKLRALYQRKKGRDLFDLFYAQQRVPINFGLLIACYKEYIDFAVDIPPSKKQFLKNLDRKRTDPNFAGDMEGLLQPGFIYNQNLAFNWIENTLNEYL